MRPAAERQLVHPTTPGADVPDALLAAVKQPLQVPGDLLLALLGLREFRLELLNETQDPLVRRGLRALTGHRHLPSFGWVTRILSGAAPVAVDRAGAAHVARWR
jgi:hypothetical protein